MVQSVDFVAMIVQLQTDYADSRVVEDEIRENLKQQTASTQAIKSKLDALDKAAQILGLDLTVSESTEEEPVAIGNEPF